MNRHCRGANVEFREGIPASRNFERLYPYAPPFLTADVIAIADSYGRPVSIWSATNEAP